MPLLTRSLALTVLLFSIATASAQQSPVPADPRSRTITLNVMASGAAANGLSAQDFRLFDNKAPRPITAVREISASTEPARVIVVIDAVNTAFTLGPQ